MAGNVYDQVLEDLGPGPAAASAPPQTSVYDDVLQSQDAALESQTRASLIDAAKTTPDRSAEARRLSLHLGVPQAVIERNFDQYQTRATLDATPYQAMGQETPALSTWVQNPANASVSHDDLDKLGALEWLVTAPQRAVAQALNEQKYGALRTKSLFSPLTQDEQDQLDAAKFHAQLGGKLGAGDSWFKGAITGGLKFLTFLGSASPYAAAGATAGALLGGAGGLVLGPEGALAGAVAGGRTGFQFGEAFGLGRLAFETAAGPAYDSFLGMKDELGQPLDPDVAKGAALAVGAINAGLMGVSGELVLKSIPGVEKLAGRFTQDAVAVALRQPTVRAALGDLVKRYGTTLTEGTALTVAQQAVEIVGAEVAKTASGQPFTHATPSEVGGQLAEAAGQGLQSFALAAVPGPLMGLARDVQRARIAETNVDLVTALGEGITNSKTAQRSPEATEDFLTQATKDGPVATLYAPTDTWTTYWQSKGINPAAMADAVTGHPGAFDEAVRTGTDLPIPTAAYAVKLAGTEHNAFFAQEVRLGDPTAMNGREAEAFHEAQTAQAAEPPAEPSSRDQVRAQVLAQLESAAVPQATAEHYASLIEAGVGTLAERAGVDPTALYQQYGLSVARPELGATDAPPTPATDVPEPAQLGAAAKTLFQTGFGRPRGTLGPSNARGEAAYFIGWQPGFEDIPAAQLYTVEGGPRHGTSMTDTELRAYGIEPPETPPKPAGYAQDAGGDKRGAITFGADRQTTIQLFAKADLSTFLHESGHFFLEVLGDLTDHVRTLDPESLTPAQQQLVADHDAVLKSFGVETRAAVGTAQHEQFARQFERYLADGRAPTVELRSTFTMFRAWLVGVYRSLKALGTPVTDEVRGVMDRLLASDDAIREAEDAGRLEPMFTTATDAGMTDSQFDLYRQTVADASRIAREQLDAQVMRDVQREQAAQWKAQEDVVREQVTADVQAQPVYRAIAAMRAGMRPDGSPLVEGRETEPLKLSKALIVERYGEGRLRTLREPFKANIYTAEGGADPDVVAAMFGFSSGDELLSAVTAAVPIDRAIKDGTAQRMQAEHPSILLDGTLHDRAQLAAANDRREGIIRAEVKALWEKKADNARAYERRWLEAEAKLRIAIAEGHKQVDIDKLTEQVRSLKAAARGGAARINAALPSAKALAAAAQQRIAGTRIADLKPALFWSASRRGAQQAIDAAARQEFGPAITAKQQELINLAYYREAERVREDIDARVAFVRGLTTPASRARIGKAGLGLQDQIDGILDRFDFARVSRAALDRRGELRRWAASLEAQGLPVDLSDDLLDETRRRNYRELTVDEFTGVTDGLKQIVHLARIQNRLLRADAKATLSETAATLSTSIREKFTGKAPAVARDRGTGQTGRLIADYIASHVRLADFVREADGGQDGGPLWDNLMRPLNEAGAREATMTAEATAKLGAVIETAYPLSEKRRLYEKTFVPSVRVSLSRMERLMIAMNWGNEGNRDRIRSYEGWTDEQVRGVLDTLDARDLTFVQGVLDHVNSYKDAIAAKQERVYGVAPTMVDALPITAAAGTIPGGYFPLKYDDRLSATAARNLDVEASGLAKQAAYVSATTARGHTKERVAHVNLPLRRDFGPIYEHIGQVIHDLTHHEALIDVGRILAHRDVQSALYETQGDLAYKQIKNAIRDVAFGPAGATNGFEKAMAHVRSGAAIANLGWSLTTPLLHLSGALPKAFARIGSPWVLAGLKRWVRGPETMQSTVEWINEHNAGMANRFRTQTRELNELRNAVGADTGKLSGWVADVLDKTSFGLVDKQRIADSYFYLVTKSQQVADLVTYLGQYEKSRTAGEPDDRAHAIAEQAVLDAFGGGQVKDLPAVMRGNALLKVWTTFYGPFNSTLNLMRAATRRASLSSPRSVGRLGVDYLLLWSMPAVLGYAVRQAMRTAPAQAGKDEDANALAVTLAKEHASYLADMLLGTRELAGFIHGYHDYSGPAGASIFADLGNLYMQGEQEAAAIKAGTPEKGLDPAFWKALDEAGGVLFHYPAGQLDRTMSGVAALSEGRTQNPLAVLWGAPAKKASGQ